MKQRVMTSVLLALVLIPIIFVNTIVPMILLGFILVSIAGLEYARLSKSNVLVITLISILTYSCALYFNYYNKTLIFSNIFIILIIIQLFYLAYVVLNDAKLFIPHYLTALLYMGVGFSSFVMLKIIDVRLILYLIIVIAVTDSFAFFFGVKYGKRKLAPTISPKKSVEGSIAGLVGGLIIGVLVVYLLHLDEISIFSSLLTSSLVTILVSSLGQIGDLFASKIKRTYGKKDFSNLFPGHGGVLDRFDSWIIGSMVLIMFLLTGV
ncbi:phosphatidate cytidylyltransferase [Mycoplasmatota bacterium zrk1]